MQLLTKQQKQSLLSGINTRNQPLSLLNVSKYVSDFRDQQSTFYESLLQDKRKTVGFKETKSDFFSNIRDKSCTLQEQVSRNLDEQKNSEFTREAYMSWKQT